MAVSETIDWKAEMSQKLEALNAKIEAQAEKLRQLKEQKAKAERRVKAAVQKQERAKDTRRKILLGAMLLEKLKRGEADVNRILADLDPFLKRNADRELFGLPPLATNSRPNRGNSNDIAG